VLRITETCKHGALLQLFCKMWCKIRGLAEHVHNHILDYFIVHKYQRKIIRCIKYMMCATPVHMKLAGIFSLCSRILVVDCYG